MTTPPVDQPRGALPDRSRLERQASRIVLVVWWLLSACGSDPMPPEPTAGTLELTVATTGHDFDPDGYSVTVDAGSPVAAPTNGKVTIADLEPGVHAVTLTGLAGNCVLTTPAPLEITVPGAAGVAASLQITCTAVYALAYRGDSGVELTDAGGTVHRTLVSDAGIYAWSPLVWSPDGRLLAVTRQRPGEVGVSFANPDDGSISHLEAYGLPCCTSTTVGVWSPDGRELLLESEFRSHTTSVGLVRFPVDGSYPPQGVIGVQWDGFGGGVPRQAGLRGYMWPDWSPDGSQIVIHDIQIVRQDLQQTYILSRDGTSKRLLADGEQPDWSPDGNAIVYVAAGAGHGALHLIQPDGGNDRPLTTPPTDETDAGPAWSPDGSRVAFVRLGHAPDSTVTSVHAYVIDRDGSNERQLAALPVGSFLPTWSADGLHLAYSGDGTYAVNLDGSGFRLVSAQATRPAQWRP